MFKGVTDVIKCKSSCDMFPRKRGVSQNFWMLIVKCNYTFRLTKEGI